MLVTINVNVAGSPEQERLASIERLLTEILYNQRRQAQESGNMSEQLVRLQAEVEENTEVIGSAVTLIGGLAQQIRDLQDDPAALAALADQLDAQTASLAAAVAANTTQPAEPEPLDEPAELNDPPPAEPEGDTATA